MSIEEKKPLLNLIIDGLDKAFDRIISEIGLIENIDKAIGPHRRRSDRTLNWSEMAFLLYILENAIIPPDKIQEVTTRLQQMTACLERREVAGSERDKPESHALKRLREVADLFRG
jgi:hypothetical protein